MAEDSKEKRKYLRIDATYVVSYCAREESPYYNISQMRNISQGGAVFTADKDFSPGMVLTLIMRFPFLLGKKIEAQARVVDSKKRKASLYEIRVEFVDLDEEIFRKIGEFISDRRQ